jgi:hypothetical protein
MPQTTSPASQPSFNGATASGSTVHESDSQLEHSTAAPPSDRNQPDADLTNLLAALPQTRRPTLPKDVRFLITDYLDRPKELKTLMLVLARDNVRNGHSRDGSATCVREVRYPYLKQNVQFDQWAKDNPHRFRFAQQVERQLMRDAGGRGILSMAYAVEDSKEAIAAFLDAPPLPANVTAIFAPNGEIKAHFDMHQSQKTMSEDIWICSLPDELMQTCTQLPLLHRDLIDDHISATGDLPGASSLATLLADYQAWKKSGKSNKTHRIVVSRIDGAECCNTKRLVLTDLGDVGRPPPWLPPCIDEVYVRDEQSASAYKAKYPDVKIFCLDTLERKLNGQGQKLAQKDFTLYVNQYAFAESETMDAFYESHEALADHRQLAEFTLDDLGRHTSPRSSN